MKVKIVHSTQGCEDSTCPTIYVNEQGNYVIQGFKIKPTDKKGLNLPRGEDAVEIPADFLKAFIAKQQ